MKKEKLVGWLEYFYTKDIEKIPNHGTATDAYMEIWAILQKPEVTEEWIEEKAKELLEVTSDKDFSASVREWNAEDFIRKFVEEISK